MNVAKSTVFCPTLFCAKNKSCRIPQGSPEMHRSTLDVAERGPHLGGLHLEVIDEPLRLELLLLRVDRLGMNGEFPLVLRAHRRRPANRATAHKGSVCFSGVMHTHMHTHQFCSKKPCSSFTSDTRTLREQISQLIGRSFCALLEVIRRFGHSHNFGNIWVQARAYHSFHDFVVGCKEQNRHNEQRVLFSCNDRHPGSSELSYLRIC